MDSCDVGQKDDAGNTTALPRTVDEAIRYSVRGTNFNLLGDHEPLSYLGSTFSNIPKNETEKGKRGDIAVENESYTCEK
jgi:hypothetical protein